MTFESQYVQGWLGFLELFSTTLVASRDHSNCKEYNVHTLSNAIHVLPLYLVVIIVVDVTSCLHNFSHPYQQQVVVLLYRLQSILIHHIFLQSLMQM